MIHLNRSPRTALAAPLALILTLVLIACQSGEPESAPTPAASPTGAALSPTIQSSLTPTASPAGPPDGTVDLALATPLITIWAADTGDLTSDRPSMAIADFNGDGFGDILIGARFGDGPDNARKDAGEVYVIFGSASPPREIDIAAGEQGLTITGADPGDNLGLGVGAGDVNGDGIDDVIVGAPFARSTDGRSKVGAAYVLFGSPDLGGDIDLAEEAPGLTLIGPASSSFFGDHIASGDVNGDGVADIIVGATFAPLPAELGHGSAQVGAVYVVFGSPQLSGTIDTSDGEYDAAMFGAEALDEVGDAVTVGDVNGDGIADVITVGEAADGPNNERAVAGEVHVFFGSPQLGGILTIGKDGDQDLTIYGAEENDTLGFSLASGDVNGDGFDDIVMVARLADGPDNTTPSSGELHIVLGSPSLGGTLDAADGQTDASLAGADHSDLLSAVVLADLDGDGVMEIIASTGFGDGPNNERLDAGEAYIVSAEGLGRDENILSVPTLRLVVYGASEGDRLGAAVVAGDITGDGKIELVLMSVAGDGPGGSRPEAGQVYVISIGE